MERSDPIAKQQAPSGAVGSTHALHIADEGPRGAPALVLIHGTAGCAAWWKPLAAALAAHRRVVRVDLAGHGRSPPAGSYDVPAQADRVAGVIDGLGLGAVTVVGHSSGGYVATALAERRPDRVAAVALINTGPSPAAFRAQGGLGKLVFVPIVGRLLWALGPAGAIRKGLASAFTRPVEVPDELVAAVRGMTYRAFTASQRASLAYLAQRSVPDRLAALGVPLLVIFGAEDRRWDAASAQGYAAVPGARIEMLAGVGHTPMFEEPRRTGELLLDFPSR